MATIDKLRHGYHDLLRPEILDLIPIHASRILDLGCGTGLLGKALKARQQCQVTGFEINKEAADTATLHLDKVIHDNLNRYDPTYLKNSFDCIILADILEHLISPWSVLKKFSQALTDDGVIIASIPNIAHPWIISQLQKGLFRYESQGLLDATHLRFFTKTTIFQLFFRANLKITDIKEHPSKENPTQYLVTAKKPKLRHQDAEVTLLMLTLNAWRYTFQAIMSIKARTRVPFKLIVIDNGSTDETVQELRKDSEIYHIENTCNLGFARGFNVGIELVTTPYFAILNNDIIVTSDWLSKMINHMQYDLNIVAIGPMSNYVSGPQHITDVHYSSITSLEQYVLDRVSYPIQELIYTNRLVFFCTLLKSTAISHIGYLDEQFVQGNFEDDDYCQRIAAAKKRMVIDNTVFIHHYGNRTFRENEFDYKKIFEENKKRFYKKWQINAPKDT